MKAADFGLSGGPKRWSPPPPPGTASQHASLGVLYELQSSRSKQQQSE